MSDRNKVLSTGVIKKHPASNIAHIEIVNLDVNDSRAVIVQVFNWDTNRPVAIPVTPANTVTINPNTLVSFDASLVGVQDHFEVRITFVRTSEDVVANVFELQNDTPLKSIWHEELRRVFLD
ncbi:hypothetical protein R4Z10_18895 [Niallia sp. XMNu-256]|uniref:hypothetical protein n=1 Tax=Niallia sp. XMNu-256 TaxID=3082444 RepID=UPI0030CFE9F5